MRKSIVEIDEIKDSKKKLTIIACIAAFVLGVLIFAFFVFRVEEITVVGNKHYSEEEIKEAVFDSKYKEHIVYLWFSDKIQSHKEFPFIDRYEVDITGTGSVKIIVYEKDIKGCFEQMGSYLFFNSEGTLLECGSELVDGVPLITGLSFDSAVLYEKINVHDESVFEKVANLVQILERNDLEVSKIHFDTSGNAILYIDSIRVELGRNDNLDGQILELKNILPKLAGQAGTLDMTYYAADRKDASYPFIYD